MFVKQITVSPEEALRRQMGKAKWIGCAIACLLIFAGFFVFQREHLVYGVPISFLVIAFCMLAPEMVLKAFWDVYQSIVAHMPGGSEYRRSVR